LYGMLWRLQKLFSDKHFHCNFLKFSRLQRPYEFTENKNKYPQLAKKTKTHVGDTGTCLTGGWSRSSSLWSESWKATLPADSFSIRCSDSCQNNSQFSATGTCAWHTTATVLWIRICKELKTSCRLRRFWYI
jgi:hypothetical protein